jgi:hypothetical protein
MDDYFAYAPRTQRDAAPDQATAATTTSAVTVTQVQG